MEKNCFSLFLTGYMRKQYCVLLLLLYALTTNAQMYVGGTFGFTSRKDVSEVSKSNFTKPASKIINKKRVIQAIVYNISSN